MAKKRRRRKTSLMTKAINVGVLLLAFSRPLQVIMSTSDLGFAAKVIAREASFGMTEHGKFKLSEGMNIYGPMVGALILKKVISMVRKSAHF